MNRKDPSIAPAHGGVGDTATGGGEPSFRKAGASPVTTGAVSGKLSGLAGAEVGVGAGGVLGPGKARRGRNRVKMLGSALDEVENRGDGPGGKGGRAVRDRSGEKVCAYAVLFCFFPALKKTVFVCMTDAKCLYSTRMGNYRTLHPKKQTGASVKLHNSTD